METGPARLGGISLDSKQGARSAGVKFFHVKSSARAARLAQKPRLTQKYL